MSNPQNLIGKETRVPISWSSQTIRVRSFPIVKLLILNRELTPLPSLDYDISEIKKTITQTLTGVGIIAFLHLQFKFTQPLVVQSVLAFKTFFLSKEALIHVWGEPTVGVLRRPFKNESPFGGMMGQAFLTDKASIKRVEKAMKNE
jgi:Phosphate transport (Pho88)